MRMIVGEIGAQIVGQPGVDRHHAALACDDFGAVVSQPPRTARRWRVTLTDPPEPGTRGNLLG